MVREIIHMNKTTLKELRQETIWFSVLHMHDSLTTCFYSSTRIRIN